MPPTDQTHDPNLPCWVASAHHHPDFPIQNLPLGIFAPHGAPPRGGVAIGDQILDLQALADIDPAAAAAHATSLNALLALGSAPRATLRRHLSQALSNPARQTALAPFLHQASACTLHLPCAIADYTDFYAGIHHATNVGKLFRPETPLLPNYKYVPIGYHGRASSIRPSGTPLLRPHGQIKLPDAPAPTLAATARLDYELELGIWIGPGNQLGRPIPIGQAADHIAGFCLLNDWSARDLQAWEYQPLGPFLAKNFLTTISPWIITPEALAPFRRPQPPRPANDPAPLAYLLDTTDQARGALDITLEITLATARMRAARASPTRLACTNTSALYWTVAQLVAHHASNGCNLNPGDLLGTGTISSTSPTEVGSLLELTQGGRVPLTLPNGETRTFLEAGDEITLHARATAPGFAPIGFGPCTGVVVG